MGEFALGQSFVTHPCPIFGAKFFPLSGMCTVSMDFTLGGSELTIRSETLRYEERSGTRIWTKLNDLLTPRYAHRSVLVNGAIVHIGGNSYQP